MKFRTDVQSMKGSTVLALYCLFLVGIIILFIPQHQIILVIVGILLENIDEFLFSKQKHNRILSTFYTVRKDLRIYEVQRQKFVLIRFNCLKFPSMTLMSRIIHIQIH